jgi:FAD:protein FMN transferase
MSRRQALSLGGAALVVALTPAALRWRRRRAVTRTIPVMGTVAEVVVVHDDPARAGAGVDLAFERLRWVDQAMSRFQAGADIGRANAMAWRDAVPVSAATAAVVEEALRWADRTGGSYDPGLARVMDIWDVANRHEPPPASAFARLAGRHLYRHVVVDRRGAQAVLRYDDPEAALDLGGIAKGYGVDLAVEALRSAGFRDAIVNAGGDLYAMGVSAEGDPWRVGVRSPTDPSRIERELLLSDEAVATSGDYFQGFDYAGRRYGHIMDSDSASPRQAVDHTVTVRAPRCLTADAAATAVFGLTRDRAAAMLARAAPEARLG